MSPKPSSNWDWCTKDWLDSCLAFALLEAEASSACLKAASYCTSTCAATTSACLKTEPCFVDWNNVHLGNGFV